MKTFDAYRLPMFRRMVETDALSDAERFLIQAYLEREGSTLEAGTGGGRILFAMRDMGYSRLAGYDFVPELIEAARAKDELSCISFDVGDGTSLRYEDAAYDQLVYLAQFVSGFTDEASQRAAVNEAFRVLKPGGVALFSCLYYPSRRKSRAFSLYLSYIGALRRLRRSELSPQAIPWLRMGEGFNLRALLDIGPWSYWYEPDEFLDQLEEAGFEVAAGGTAGMAGSGLVANHCRGLDCSAADTSFYAVCRKPSA
ncbi:MAG: class I SAM-dependent methyltransferase [Candidatus Geothermincolia bacterium]